jgi:hypothetical protein
MASSCNAPMATCPSSRSPQGRRGKIPYKVAVHFFASVALRFLAMPQLFPTQRLHVWEELTAGMRAIAQSPIRRAIAGGLCFPQFGPCAIILTTRIARPRSRSSTSEAIYAIQFRKVPGSSTTAGPKLTCISSARTKPLVRRTLRVR